MTRKKAIIIMGIGDTLAILGFAKLFLLVMLYLTDDRAPQFMEVIGVTGIFLIIILATTILSIGIFLFFIGLNGHYRALHQDFPKKLYAWPIFFTTIGGRIANRKLEGTNKEAAEALKHLGWAMRQLVLLQVFILFPLIFAIFKIVFLLPILKEIYENMGNL